MREVRHDDKECPYVPVSMNTINAVRNYSLHSIPYEYRALVLIEICNLAAQQLEARSAEREPCEMGEICLGCEPRGAKGECPDAAPNAVVDKSSTRSSSGAITLGEMAASAMKVIGASDWHEAMAEVSNLRRDLEALQNAMMEAKVLGVSQAALDRLNAALDKTRAPRSAIAQPQTYFKPGGELGWCIHCKEPASKHERGGACIGSVERTA
jgi:hypothetical protein